MTETSYFTNVTWIIFGGILFFTYQQFEGKSTRSDKTELTKIERILEH